MPLKTILGNSELTQQLKVALPKIAPSKAPILIRGSSGVGKEVVAKAIHGLSGRDKSGRFVAINCSAIPADLLENELFGHVKGAFSGAISDYKGRFRMADGGTLFLDEIGDMPEQLQAKMLRVLQDGTILPLGSEKEIKVDVRIISATHQNLEMFVEKGKFREDLLYRINVIPLLIADLSEKTEEIDEFFDYFAKKYSFDGRVISLHPLSSEVLKKYHWPGNVRELENFCQRLSIIFPGEIIDFRNVPGHFLPEGMKYYIQHLPALNSEEAIQTSKIDADDELNTLLDYDDMTDSTDVEDWIAISQSEKEVSKNILDEKGLKESLKHMERKLIISALNQADNNVSECARLLKINRTTLIEKINKLEISIH